MNQSKLSLADVLTVLAVLTFGFVCFLGTNFFTLGNTNQSVLLAVIISALLCGTALGAKLLKRSSRNFKTCFIGEVILLVLFTCLLFFFSYSPFPHYFNVSTHKTEIKINLETSITQAENMFSMYETYAGNREKLYKSKLQSVVASKNITPSEYIGYGFEYNGVPDNNQIENKMFTVHADLFPTNYSDSVTNNGLKEVAIEWLANANKTVLNWKPIGITNVVNDVEKNSNEWLKTLKSLSQVREKGEITNDFEYNLSFEDVKTYFTTLGKPTVFSIGLAICTWVLMMLSWFVTKRHPRFPGLKVLFGFGKTSNKDL